MADVICRWRNPSPKTVVELVSLLPKKAMPSKDFRKLVEAQEPDFFHTPYQLACQLGLYYEGKDGYIPRFCRDITTQEAQQYLEFWITRYYAPNPFTRSLTILKDPVLLLESLVKYLENHGGSADLKIALTDIFKDQIGNIDIVANSLNQYSKIIEVVNDIASLSANYKKLMEQIPDRKDKMGFFNFFDVNAGDKENSVSVSALQKIFYGCPGTGKSHELNKITEGYDVIRTTFHPNSDYATFVGAYKPVETIVPKTMTIWDSALNQAIEHPVVTSGGAAAVEKKITYQFVQQAFLKAYVEAWKKLSCSRILAGGASVTAPTSLSKIASSATSPYSSTSPGVPDPDNFEFSVEHGMDLSDDGRRLLAAIDAFNFPIIGSFKDVHEQIELVISDRRSFGGLLPDLHYSKKELQERLDKINKQLKVEKDQNRTRELLGIFGSIKDYLSNDTIRRGEKPLLGLYVPEEKKVYLFKENILDAAGDSEDSDEYKLYLASTYIHEMFHAFYDKSNVIPEIEEAIVEASTLCFLEKFRPDYASRYYSIVSRKYYSFPEYAFGAFLFDHRSVDWIKLYNDAHTISPDAPLVKKYCHGVLNHRFLLREEKEDLKNILFTILTSPAPTVVPDEMNKQDVQFLVIEEINRGDCAQIFGDIFQLLDRNDYGFSSYPIEPDSDIQRALKESFEGISIPDRVDKMYKPLRSGKISDGIKEGRLMLLPSNLFIYATMNTSDQSLFPMDSAFKRRWDWRYFAIKDEGKGYQLTLDGQSYEWWKLLEELNRRILELTHSSDKQMGYWFIKLPEGVTEIPVETFVSKVVFYLWNDVFKDYAQDGGNPFTDETRFEKFYDGEGNVQNEVLKVFLENLFKEKASDENPE